MDEINIGPKHEFRLPSRRWLVLASVLALVAAMVTVIMTVGHAGRVPRPKGPSVAAAAPAPSVTRAPDSLLLTCAAANWGQLERNWRAASLKVGPLWLYGGRKFAYVPRRIVPGTASVIRQSRRQLGAVMIVEVSDGSTVVMKASDKALPYFHFIYGYNGRAGNPLPMGDTGFTLSSCPKGQAGPNGMVTDFRLGFVIGAGHVAAVDVQASASSNPVRVIFAIRTPG
jgi:hypothetical protein